MPDITEVTEERESLDVAGSPEDAVGGPGYIRHTSSPCLSPDGSMLACVVTERTGYPRAVQRPLGPGGLDGAGPERDVVLPINGPVRKVAYSPNGKWLACEVAPDGGERERIFLVTAELVPTMSTTSESTGTRLECSSIAAASPSNSAGVSPFIFRPTPKAAI